MASKDFHYEGVNLSNETTKYNKLIRYYVGKDGEKIYKVKNKDSQSNAHKRIQVEAGEWLCYVCNHLDEDASLDNVNYLYYIDRAENMITKILTGGKRIRNIVVPNQLNLFG
jgi:hypothetical protein